MGTRTTLSSMTLPDSSVLPTARQGGAWYGAEGTPEQPVANATDTIVQFPSVEWNNGITVGGTGNTSFTLPAGVWSVAVNARMAAHTVGVERYLAIVSAAAPTTVRYAQQGATPTSSDRSLNCTTIVRFTAPAGISVLVWQDSGVTLNLQRLWHGLRLHIARLGT